MLTLRRVTPDDAADVLALNQRNVEILSPMSRERLWEIEALADRFDVMDVDGAFGGFVVTIRPGTAYDSEKYRWYAERYGSFYYLDRIVLHEDMRRLGLGTLVYDQLEASARPFGRFCLEVNLVPRNDASLSFHLRRGYVEVGRLGDAAHLVAMMEKQLS